MGKTSLSKVKLMTFDEWLQKIVVIIDTREKNIFHIVEIFRQVGIKFEISTLPIADYTFRYRNDDFTQDCLIERKNSLNELSSNFTKYRARFKAEFDKLDKFVKCHLVIEDNTLDDLIGRKYTTKIKRNSFIASLLSFSYRYDIHVHFISKNYSAYYICKLFYYYYYYLNKI